MNLIGKTLKSKINGNVFVVKELKTYSGRQWYTICEVKTGKCFYIDKDWFENGIMQNLEIITE